MAMNKPEEIKKSPITFEIHADRNGKPYLKKVERRRNVSVEGRGAWMPIGRDTDTGIDRVLRLNKLAKNLVLIDQDGTYRVLVLTE